MCGIAGYWGDYQPELLGSMGRAQAQRGPDDHQVWHQGRVGFAHERLAILDLSPAGRQPMWDFRQQVLIVFNGEIYNYQELRVRLEQQGVPFRGESDTEVLVNLLSVFGLRCLPWLNGIFAFAAWFPAEQKMVLARDAAGVKPLYWTQGAQGRCFASEIKALQAVPDLNRELNPLAIAAYLSLLHAPGELTPLRGIQKVLPGTYLEWTEGNESKVHRFAPLPYAQPIEDLSLSDAVAGCRHYLQQAVRRQLVSDVPLGGFLSGGVDSTAIAYYATKALGDGAKYPCFTIGPSHEASLATEGFVEDYPYAQLVSRQFKLPLSVSGLTGLAPQQIDRLVYQLDEPTPDLAAFTTWVICQQARAQGVKVLLSGAGGDDIFSGYRRHQALASEKYWGWWPLGCRQKIRQWTQKTSPQNPLGRRISKLFRYADKAPDERLASYFLWIEENTLATAFSEEFQQALGMQRPVDILQASLRQLPPKVSRLNQMLHLDRSYFLSDQNLNYNDKMAMACGVEVRVPFLDLDLVSFSERLPDHFKQAGTQSKFILKEAMRGILPDEILTRPKSGFGLPLRQLLHKVYAPHFKALAQEGRLEATGVFSSQGVLKLLAADAQGEVDAAYPLLGVLFMESWLRQFNAR